MNSAQPNIALEFHDLFRQIEEAEAILGALDENKDWGCEVRQEIFAEYQTQLDSLNAKFLNAEVRAKD
jgi:hypothetical protein